MSMDLKPAHPYMYLSNENGWPLWQIYVYGNSSAARLFFIHSPPHTHIFVFIPCTMAHSLKCAPLSSIKMMVGLIQLGQGNSSHGVAKC